MYRRFISIPVERTSKTFFIVEVLLDDDDGDTISNAKLHILSDQIAQHQAPDSFYITLDSVLDTKPWVEKEYWYRPINIIDDWDTDPDFTIALKDLLGPEEI